MLALLVVLHPAYIEPAGDLQTTMPEPVIALPAPVSVFALLSLAPSLVPITARSREVRDKWAQCSIVHRSNPIEGEIWPACIALFLCEGYASLIRDK